VNLPAGSSRKQPSYPGIDDPQLGMAGGPRQRGRATHRKGARVAQQTKVLLTDDLDGGDAEETITFGFDSTDRSQHHPRRGTAHHADNYITKARCLGRATSRSSSAPRPA
jgi:hypothetical protein